MKKLSEKYKLKVIIKEKEEKKSDISSINYSLNNVNENTISFNEDNDINIASPSKETILYGNDYSLIAKPSIIGSTRIYFFIKNYPIISIGKNITIPLLLLLFVCLLYIFIFCYFFKEAGIILQKMFNYFFLAYFISHLLAVFINPGIPSFEYHKNISKGLKENRINELDCTRCNSCNLVYKLKDNIGHCHKCNICYYGFDHHCIWTGHCIGKYNKYFFGSFVFTLFIFLLICLTMIFIKIIAIIIKEKKH
jgi:hypothetical protein